VVVDVRDRLQPAPGGKAEQTRREHREQHRADRPGDQHEEYVAAAGRPGPRA
jgi:hypothetical protein